MKLLVSCCSLVGKMVDLERSFGKRKTYQAQRKGETRDT